MSELILRALMQAGRVINNPFAMNNGYVLPKRGDARSDFTQVVGDMRTVGKDLSKTIRQETKRHGK
jgi:hypothetical protein